MCSVYTRKFEKKVVSNLVAALGAAAAASPHSVLILGLDLCRAVTCAITPG